MIDRAKRYADRVSKSASDVTQTVVNRQNTLRRRLNERIKSVAAVDVGNRDNWRLIVAQLRRVLFQMVGILRYRDPLILNHLD